MGKKKRSHPDVEELLARPWCYYCERDFEDLKLLISHQKAKHFKCDRCGRRLNTAGGLSVHMNQVHKEPLSNVENALPNRQGLDIEIFGMEGVPEDIIHQHNQRIIQNYYNAQAERRAATGNPPPGQTGSQGPAKKLKVESADDLKKRLAEHRAQVAARKANPTASNGNTSAHNPSPGAFISPFPPPQPGFDYSQQYPAGVPGAPPYQQQYPGGYPHNVTPFRPADAAGTTTLPQRSGYAGNQPGGNASTLDDLVAGASRTGDNIDQIIRMAEAGIKPPRQDEKAAAPAEKTKKEKAMRMIYSDGDYSLEEKMSQFPRYAISAGA